MLVSKGTILFFTNEFPTQPQPHNDYKDQINRRQINSIGLTSLS